jgi:F-type H+-transporting ATPase subunit epsilon
MLNVQVMFPEGEYFDQVKVNELYLTTLNGPITILGDHAPMVTILDIGVCSLKIENNWKSFVGVGGYADVIDNNVIILMRDIIEIKDKAIEDVMSEIQQSLSSLKDAKTLKLKMEAAQEIRLKTMILNALARER